MCVNRQITQAISKRDFVVVGGTNNISQYATSGRVQFVEVQFGLISFDEAFQHLINYLFRKVINQWPMG